MVYSILTLPTYVNWVLEGTSRRVAKVMQTAHVCSIWNTVGVQMNYREMRGHLANHNV